MREDISTHLSLQTPEVNSTTPQSKLVTLGSEILQTEQQRISLWMLTLRLVTLELMWMLSVL